jgi:subtilase family serine protease
MSRIRSRAAIAAALAGAAALAAGLAVPPGAGATTAPPVPAVRAILAPAPGTAPSVVVPLLGQAHGAPVAGARAATTRPAPITSPLTPSECAARWHIACYSAGLLRKVYGLGPDEGKGAIIGLIMPYDNPHIMHDLGVYARQSGLGTPDFHVISIGHPAVASPSNPAQDAAETEETLDVEMLYATAPKARINLYQTPVDFSLSPNGFSYYAGILKWVAAQRPRVDAVSLSLGFAEQNYAEENGNSTAAGNAVIQAQATALNASINDGITLTVATGDTGAAGIDLAGTGLYTSPSVLFPASDPAVIGASGTEVRAGNAGNRVWADEAWANQGDYGATGGGVSTVFARPSYQNPYSTATGRGVGDISMDAATESAVWMYSSVYDPFPGEAPGWMYVAGTSAAAPEFTGIVGDTAAQVGHPMGDIHPELYALAAHPAANGIESVWNGCNADYGIDGGYCAASGPWSPDGVGTVGNGRLFVAALARAALARAA